MLTRLRHSLNTKSLTLSITVAILLATVGGNAYGAGGSFGAVSGDGSFDALSGSASGSGALVAPLAGGFGSSSALLVREHESAFGSFGGESPQALTVDQATGDVYVVDPGGKELWRFSSTGAAKDFTSGPDAGTNTLTGLSFPSFTSYAEVAVDASSGPSKGSIYVTINGQVKVFASSGEPLGSLSGSGTPAGSFGEDCGVAVDQSNGDLYVASRGSRIWRYSPSGTPVIEANYSGGIETSIEPCQIAVANGNVYAKDWQETFPVEGAGALDAYAISAFATGSPPLASGTQVVSKATAVATDPVSGDVYVDERTKITVYGPTGTPLYNYGTGEIGTRSTGVAVMAGGSSYVSDANAKEVHVYGPTLEPGSRANLGEFGSFTGESPQALTVDQATGDVYVVDPSGKKLWRYSAGGAPKNFTAGPDAGTNTLTGLSFQSFPSYDEVAVDNSPGPAKGDIYVTQSPSGQVKVFSSTGEPLGTLTGSGTPSSGLGEACGVAVDQATGDLYIGDRSNRIWRYTPTKATVEETDYTGGIETSITPCQIAVANGSVYAKDWQEFPVEGAGPLDAYAISAFATGTPPSPSATQVATKVTAVATDPSNGDIYADERSKVTVYGPSGAPIYTFASGEIGSSSAGVAIKTSGGQAYVDDAANHRVRIYGPFSAPAPLLEAKPASGVTHVKATLNGHLDPNSGLPITTCTFQWGTDTNYTETPVSCEQGDTYTAPADLTAKLTGLTPGTTYHYRLHVTTSNGSYDSNDQAFETIPASSTPEVKTGKGSIVSSTSTQMSGTVDPNANPLTGCHFEYVNDLAYQNTGFTNLSSGGSIPCDQSPGSIPADYEDHEVTATATGLDPKQIYRYRLVAENTNGTGNGQATLLPGPPIAETTGSPTRTATTARLDSRVATHGAHTNYWFQYTTDADYKANGYNGATTTPVTPLLVSEVQRLYFNWGSNPGGEFRFTVGSETTRDIPYNATAAEVQAALGTLPGIGAANVVVAGTEAGVRGLFEFYYVTFTGALSGVDLPQLAISNGTNPLVGLNSESVVETMVQGGRGDVVSVVSAPLQDLQPNTTYHYRVVADNGTPGGPTVGGDQTLTTRASDAPPTHGHFVGPRGSDRAWEQVNTPDTDGNRSFVKSVSDSGERVLYAIDGGTPGSINGGDAFGAESDIQLTERTSSGWKNRSLFPPRAQAPGNLWRGIWGSTELNELFGFNRDQTGSGTGSMWAMRPGGVDQELYSVSLESYNPTGNWAAASNDGSRMIIVLNGSNDPAYPLPESEPELYDLSSGSPKLIGLLPGNTLPACGVHMNTGGGLVSPIPQWITPDGSHMFFYAHSGATNCENGSGSLYDRDIANSTTKLIAASGNFIRSAGGSVFFYTEESLVSGDPGESDIYRYQIDDGSYHCITCSLPGGPDGHADYNQGLNSDQVVSNHGSRIYFISKRRLLPGAAPRGIYRIDVSNGDLVYVAPVDPLTQFSYGSETGTAISPDGSWLAFRSADPELNAVNGLQDNDTSQFYLYNDADGSVVCASCTPDGSAPRGDAYVSSGPGGTYYLGANGGALNNDGDYVFSTPTPLVPADQNTATSAENPERGTDLYEWRDGRLLLVTDGKTESAPTFDGMSPSGRDVFFNQAVALTPDAIDSSNHLYDARVGGGFDFPSPPPPCSLEACQGTPLPPPGDATPASLSFSGPGNQKGLSVSPKKTKECVGGKCGVHRKKRCAKGRVLKHGKCVRKVVGKHARRANHNKGGAK